MRDLGSAIGEKRFEKPEDDKQNGAGLAYRGGSEPELLEVVFFRNPRKKVSRQSMVAMGENLVSVGARTFESKYLGKIISEPGNRMNVFPDNGGIETALDDYFAQHPDSQRALLKVYCIRLDWVAKAIAVDEERFAEICLSPDAKRRLTALETEVRALKDKIDAATGVAIAERMLAVVDFQNIRYTLRLLFEAGVKTAAPLEVVFREAQRPEQGIKILMPRVIEEVLIFDFDSNGEEMTKLKRSWTAHGYTFAPVPADKERNNTDEFLVKKTMERVERGSYGWVLLVSGDNDFVPLVTCLQEKGIKVMSAAYNVASGVELITHVNWHLSLDSIAH